MRKWVIKTDGKVFLSLKYANQVYHFIYFVSLGGRSALLLWMWMV